MAWYDRLADDPQQILDEIAEWRGLTRAEFDARRDRIHEAASIGGPHLTLNQIDAVRCEDPRLPPSAMAHLGACEYCKALVDALNPTVVDRNREKAETALAAADYFADDVLEPAAESAAVAQGSRGMGLQGIARAVMVVVVLGVGYLWFGSEIKTVVQGFDGALFARDDSVIDLSSEDNHVIEIMPASYVSAGKAATPWEVVLAGRDDDGQRILQLKEMSLAAEDILANSGHGTTDIGTVISAQAALQAEFARLCASDEFTCTSPKFKVRGKIVLFDDSAQFVLINDPADQWSSVDALVTDPNP